MFPKIIARQFIERYRPTVEDLSAKAIAIEHLKTARSPAPPYAHVADVANGNAGGAEVEIDQRGRAFPVKVSAFHDDTSITSRFFRDGINLERFHKRRRRVR